MTEQKRALSLGAIIIVWVFALAASLTASYVVQRFVLHKPHPRIQTAVIVGATLPVFLLLLLRRRRKSG